MHQKCPEITAGRFCQLQEGGHGENATSQVRAHGLVQTGRVSNQIQYVIDELKRHTKILAEFAEPMSLLVGELTGQSPHPTRAREQLSGLGLDCEQIATDLLGDVEEMLSLGRLADAELGDGTRDIGRHSLTRSRSFGGSSRHQIRPSQERLVLTLDGVDRRRSSSSLRPVEYVVVYQRAHLNQLDGDSRRNNPGIEDVSEVGHRDREGGAKPFPTTTDDTEAWTR